MNYSPCCRDDTCVYTVHYIFTPVCLCRSRIVRSVIQFDPETIYDEDHDANSPLQLACLNGQLEVARVLMDANCAIENRSDISSLHVTLIKHHIKQSSNSPEKVNFSENIIELPLVEFGPMMLHLSSPALPLSCQDSSAAYSTCKSHILKAYSNNIHRYMYILYAELEFRMFIMRSIII